MPKNHSHRGTEPPSPAMKDILQCLDRQIVILIASHSDDQQCVNDANAAHDIACLREARRLCLGVERLFEAIATVPSISQSHLP